METLKLNGKTIIGAFQYQLCKNFDEALKMGVNDYAWEAENIKEGIEKICVKLEDGEIIDTKLKCIYIDSGSVDYIYYI